MGRGGLKPGGFLDLNRLAGSLGISRTPLRDALLQLEVEGFVEILPRRGIRLRPLTAEEIRNLYQIVGALESAAVAVAGPRLGKAGLARMQAENLAMRRALAAGDYDLFHAHNRAFHGVFLDACANPRMAALVESLKQRLYDWPRRETLLADWEERSLEEHARLVALLDDGKYEEAGAFHRDVHWSYTVQENFIRAYYQLDSQARG